MSTRHAYTKQCPFRWVFGWHCGKSEYWFIAHPWFEWLRSRVASPRYSVAWTGSLVRHRFVISAFFSHKNHSERFEVISFSLIFKIPRDTDPIYRDMCAEVIIYPYDIIADKWNLKRAVEWIDWVENGLFMFLCRDILLSWQYYH